MENPRETRRKCIDSRPPGQLQVGNLELPGEPDGAAVLP